MERPMEDREKYRSYPCELRIMRRRHEKRESGDLADKTAKSGLDEEAAVLEASRCLVNNFCRSCDLCRYLCPDLCITRDERSGHIQIDYDYCKGCGICAFVCPKGAIKMVQEE
jgi:2-oxoacid:acceptor oxidoreductase delta subunit (pyruvate/2-ketoisovalerate family)